MSGQDFSPRRCVLIGGGVIGAGWAARFVLNGLDAVLYDPSAQSRARAQAILDMARAAWMRLLPGALPAEGRLHLATTLEEALEGADFVQENLPEIETLKFDVLARIDALLPPSVPIASSTSGLLPTRLQAGLRHPERFVVGHPFNPVYLLPLVEICGGEQTSAETRDKVAAFYTAIGMQVLHVRKEVDGFIADRLLEALWREGLWLIEEGVATTAELDDAIRYGAGLRWAFMGTFLTYRLAGGDAGMKHFLAQFGPALKLPWTKLVAPELTDELIERVASQSDTQAAGVSVRDLESLRDEALVKIIRTLATVGPQGYAAGATLNAFAARHAGEGADGSVAADGTLTSWRGMVPLDWIDYNGHMTEHRYLQVFGEATDHLLAAIGAGPDYVATGHSFYTVETHLRHLGQAHEGTAIMVRTRVLDADGKRLHIFHTLTAVGDDTPLATAEHMLIHVDAAQGRSAPIPDTLASAIATLCAAKEALPPPEGAGRAIAMPRRS
ncbi:carnitine 3-dehydrogenase [Acetobacter sp. TBRC 12305]|uniref:L-carnitine dehydrogenase n=1 Tax=Acetobacter garciniae TaxID=2817435 RepID=A0A939HLI0_9PROT|nr:carnitine 3-dehydrogenase [Acetobacter garciniae]MBO1324960.1 carnitine 3-dehydrogenase [Acetobacter garciniae]MBX0344651.1 carnitine 3-dehydrogenase [Acetobacter garciniae]